MSYPVELILARNLSDHLSTPALVIDGQNALVWFNDAAAGLIGRSPADVGSLGAGWTELLPCRDDLSFLFGDTPSATSVDLKPNGKKRKMTASVTPLLISGRRAGSLVVLYDAR